MADARHKARGRHDRLPRRARGRILENAALHADKRAETRALRGALRYARALPHGAVGSGRRGQRQDGHRLRRDVRRGQGRLAVRADGSDGDSRRAALRIGAEAARAAGDPMRPADRFAHAQKQAAGARGHRVGRMAGSDRHARADHRKRRLQSSRTGHYRRAASLRRSPAHALFGKRLFAQRAGHVGHAHSAHAVADPLRRSGHIGRGRAAPRPHAGADAHRAREKAQ